MNAYIYPGLTEIDPFYIIKKVSEFYKVSPEDMKKICRKTEIRKPRQIAIAIIADRFYEQLTQESISAIFNQKHASVCHAKKVVNDELKMSKSFKKEYDALIATIGYKLPRIII